MFVMKAQTAKDAPGMQVLRIVSSEFSPSMTRDLFS